MTPGYTTQLKLSSLTLSAKDRLACLTSGRVLGARLGSTLGATAPVRDVGPLSSFVMSPDLFSANACSLSSHHEKV
jgi:hypothetical protein